MRKSWREIVRLARRQESGFTLLEMLLVVALISILAGIVILAINPGKQLADTRDAQRRADVNTILNAIYQYSLDNNGDLPASITTSAKDICQTGASSCTSLADLSDLTDSETYLVSIPIDPSADCGNANSTCYQVLQTASGRVTVIAPYAEGGADISVTR